MTPDDHTHVSPTDVGQARLMGRLCTSCGKARLVRNAAGVFCTSCYSIIERNDTPVTPTSVGQVKTEDHATLYGALLTKFQRLGFSFMVADDLAERAADVAYGWFNASCCEEHYPSLAMTAAERAAHVCPNCSWSPSDG